jgi:hypothetical protein
MSKPELWLLRWTFFARYREILKLIMFHIILASLQRWLQETFNKEHSWKLRKFYSSTNAKLHDDAKTKLRLIPLDISSFVSLVLSSVNCDVLQKFPSLSLLIYDIPHWHTISRDVLLYVEIWEMFWGFIHEFVAFNASPFVTKHIIHD